jgi:hypothetical protein
MKKMIIGLAAIAAIATVQAEAAEITWQKDIKPLFEKNCLACHGTDSPEHDAFAKDKKGFTDKGMGMRMDTYSHLITYVGWPYTGALMRRLDDGSTRSDKKAGNMYEHLGINEVERKANLEIFRNWVGNWNMKRWKDITKDELDAIKAKY